VTSPTFVVGHAYEGRDGPLAHLDLYRLAGMGVEDPGILDPFFVPGTIAFVEWPEQADGAWPRESVAARVRIEHGGGDRRTIEVDP
jgi:tRNA threonylcarbamoyladenosine biosynthesis protein TsaE